MTKLQDTVFFSKVPTAHSAAVHREDTNFLQCQLPYLWRLVAAANGAPECDFTQQGDLEKEQQY